MIQYPKRLIEVDLPIKRISEHAKAEKNLRSGHPWHLHIWWARRPWGACRAVILASLWFDPADPLCPVTFREAVAKHIQAFARKVMSSEKLGRTCSPASFGRWNTLSRPNVKLDVTNPDHLNHLRYALLDFVADFSNWDNSSLKEYLETAEALTRSAYHAMGSIPGTTPVVVDTFAGNGAIPGEALRVGCESIALDLNPVAVLVLRTLLESAPKHGQILTKKFLEGSEFIKKEAQKRLSAYYPLKEGRMPIAWLWARTVTCEGPGCGAIIPLISQTLIAKGNRQVWIDIKGNSRDKTISINIRKGKAAPRNLLKTAGGGSATCPVCGFTTPKASVKRQGKDGQMGHRLYGVAIPVGDRQGKDYFEATQEDQRAFETASQAWRRLIKEKKATEISEPFVLTYGLHVPPHYGISEWGDLFSDRQKLALYTIADILQDYAKKLQASGVDPALVRDVATALALGISNGVHYWTTMSTWLAEHMISAFITGNAIAMRWDWAEGNPLVDTYAGGLDYAFSQAIEGLTTATNLSHEAATVIQGNATELPLPDDSANMYFTDPPYYDVVPYADLSDLCYVWLKRFVAEYHPDLFSGDLTPKAKQIVVNPYVPEDGRGEQTPEHYQERMTAAFQEGRRILCPSGIAAVVFAHKGTAAWEKLLAAVIDAGFVVTASWPIDTERASRMRASKSAALGSSVHLIVRPREDANGVLQTDTVGDWREVLAELPGRIREWLPRLADEGVVGADAIFACLGPALEIFSRYARVEKASGEQVTLREYLEHVWAAVAREALHTIFAGADATGFEEDARLTAMWLWTLSTNGFNRDGQDSQDKDDNNPAHPVYPVDESSDDEEQERGSKALAGYMLEYDAARKIAQGLGAHLERLGHLVEVKGDKARLLPVSERTRYLFGKDEGQSPSRRKKQTAQLSLFDALEEAEAEDSGWGEKTTPPPGQTALDRVHQSMILFAAGRSEALKRFLVEDGVGRDARFWRLAQALSALYPAGSDEKRWIDGVLARKKGLGF